jgi:hypothetical protein
LALGLGAALVFAGTGAGRAVAAAGLAPGLGAALVFPGFVFVALFPDCFPRFVATVVWPSLRKE